MKFLKKNRFKIVIILLILGAVYLICFLKQQKIYEKNPGLIPPRNNYDVQADITPEQKSGYEAQLKKYDDLIKNFVPSTGEQEIDLGNGMVGTAETENKPEVDWFFEKARALENLGRYTESIKTLNEVFKRYENSSVAWNNLGVLWERVGEYEKAAMNFKKLYEVFPTVASVENIIYNYARAGQTKTARDLYFQYVGSGVNNQNLNLINAIREAEGKDPLTQKQMNMLKR